MTKERFTTPVGRLVQGSVDEAQTTDAQGNPRVVKTGPNAGQPNPQYFIAVAFPKDDPQGKFSEFYGVLARKAAADFPNLFPNAAAGDYTPAHPNFSMKVIDGDGIDTNGKPNAEKVGFAGHWVVRFASGYAPRVYDNGKYGPHDQIQEKGFIKRGHYVRVSGTVEGNGNAQRPGLFVNLDMVERYALGEEIISGPDAGEAFAAPAALPTGAVVPAGNPAPAAAMPPSAAAPAPVPASAPAAPATPAATTPAAPPAAPAPNAAAPAAPATPPQAAPAPAYDGYMDAGNSAPAAASPSPQPAPATPAAHSAPVATPSPTSPPPAPAAPAAAPARVMTAAANGATYESMIAAGWTDETLVQHGMMQP